MKISLGDKTIITSVFVKLVAPHQLLLSELVCRQLGIVTCYHSVQIIETRGMPTAVELSTTVEETTEEDPKLAARSVKLISVVQR